MSKSTQHKAPKTMYPDALVVFMMQHWQDHKNKKVPRLKNAAVYTKRRQLLSKQFPEECLIIPTGHEKIRANDTHYRFRPGSDFYYLTGCDEQDCVLILLPQNATKHQSVLFVEPNPHRSDSSFFTDRNKGELWVGPRLGIQESLQRFAIDACLSLHDLPNFLKQLPKTTPKRLLRGLSTSIEALVRTSKQQDAELAMHLSHMRLIKDTTEIKAIKAACAATRRGFDDMIHALKNARNERNIETVFHMRARNEGNDVGYNTIVAAGAHACILHWSNNNGTLKKDALILIDAGIEGRALYTADVTRTLPISGKFSKEQAVVYDLVYHAQQAALKAVKPGNDFLQPHREAMRVLAQGLIDLKILHGSLSDALSELKPYYRRYTLHQVSHMLGLDVHDCASASNEMYRHGKLMPGMVLTIEPGLYFQPDDITVPKRFRGIGVRIEDDVLVTQKSYALLSHLPRERRDVESWMRSIWKIKQ